MIKFFVQVVLFGLEFLQLGSQESIDEEQSAILVIIVNGFILGLGFDLSTRIRGTKPLLLAGALQIFHLLLLHFITKLNISQYLKS